MSHTSAELQTAAISAAVTAYISHGQFSSKLEYTIKRLLYNYPRLEVIEHGELNRSEILNELVAIDACYHKSISYEQLAELRDQKLHLCDVIKEYDELTKDFGYGYYHSFCLTTPQLLIVIYKRDKETHTQYVIDFLKKALY